MTPTSGLLPLSNVEYRDKNRTNKRPEKGKGRDSRTPLLGTVAETTCKHPKS